MHAVTHVQKEIVTLQASLESKAAAEARLRQLEAQVSTQDAELQRLLSEPRGTAASTSSSKDILTEPQAKVVLEQVFLSLKSTLSHVGPAAALSATDLLTIVKCVSLPLFYSVLQCVYVLFPAGNL